MKKQKKSVLLLAAMSSILLVPSCGGEDFGSIDDSKDSSSQVTYYKVTLTSGEGYEIAAASGYNADQAEAGRAFKFVVTPKKGYELVKVTMGTSNETLLPDDDGLYTINSLSGNVTINVEVKLHTYKLIFEGSGYTLSPLEGYNANKVGYGSDFKFKLIASSHVLIKSVTYMDNALTADAEGVYTINNVTANGTVYVTTEEDTYKLIVPTSDNYTVTFEDATLDVTKIPYSKEVKFKVTPIASYKIDKVALGETVLTADADGYYLIKELEGEQTLTIEVSEVRYTLTFSDPLGGNTVASQNVLGGTVVTEPTATRAADEYYESYNFDGWYKGSEKFDFTQGVGEDASLTAKWSYGKAKYDQITLSQETLGFENTGYAVMSFSNAFDQMAWENGAINKKKKALLIAEFGGEARANDGVFVVGQVGGNTDFSEFNLTMPKINFLEQLKDGKIMSMELGCRTDGGYVYFKGTQLFAASDHYVKNLTRVKAYFYLEGSDVKVVFVEKSGILEDKPYPSTRYEKTLTAEEANGTNGIVFSLGSNKFNRHYWFSHPRIEKGVTTLKDFHNKENVVITGGDFKTISEQNSDSGAPWGQWKETCALSFDGIGVYGNAETPLSVNYGKINLNSIFAKGNGIRFALGAWNGQEKLAFNSTEFGVSGEKPNNPDSHTVESLENTWKNFVVEITKFGMVVTNKNEGKEYIVSLSAGQLEGTEDITFNIGTRSFDRFFYLSNIKEFHA